MEQEENKQLKKNNSEEPQPELVNPVTTPSPLDAIFRWESAERYWVPRERPWFVGYSLFFVLLIAVFALIGEYILIILIIAFAFLWFTQAMIPPNRAVHTITPLGVKTYGKLYKFEAIKHFWFSRKKEVMYIHFAITEDRYEEEETKRVTLLIEQPGEDEELFDHLISRLDYGDSNEVGYNFLARLISGEYIGVSQYLPEETPTQEEYLASERGSIEKR